MHKKAACYIRVSTSEQAEFSPSAQLKAIQKYSVSNSIELLSNHIYIDESSGKTAENRIEFMKMISQARKKPKEFDMILVHRFDRFARSREDSVVYKSILKKEAGIPVISVTESIEDDKFSVILEAMLEAMAEYYSLNLADEVKKGMTEKALRGEFQASPPLGYKIEGRTLVPIKHESALIQNIFYRFAVEGLSFREIAILLNQSGYRTKRGNLFDGRAISYIIQNPVYIGKLRWTPNGKTDRNFSNKSSIIAQGAFEPIISKELWKTAQERIKSNKILYSKNEFTSSNISTWLKGIIKCGNCGSLLISNGTMYLQCGKYTKGQCNVSHCINYLHAEEAILAYISNEFNRKLNIKPEKKQIDNVLESKFILDKIKDIEKRFIRNKEAYLSGADTLQEYLSQKKELTMQKEALQSQLDFKTNKNCIDISSLNFLSLLDFFKSDKVPIKSKNRAIHLIFEEITFYKESNSLYIKHKKY